MTLTERQRRISLAAALGVAIAGGAVFGSNESSNGTEVVEANEAASPATPVAKGDQQRSLSLPLEKLTRTPFSPDGADLFAPKSWYVPPPPPPVVKASEPAKPVAPRLPFTYVGQIEDKGGLKIFLMRDQEMVVATPGAMLDVNYRLDMVTADQLTFVYLPLGEKQIISTGGK